MRFFDRLNSAGLFFLRVSAGSLMLFGHGYGKLIRYGDKAATFPDPLGIGHELSMQGALVGEVVAPLLIIFGLFTRAGAAIAAFTMIVAAFIVHADDPWAKKEMAVLYAVPFVTLVFTGGGLYSIERRMWDILLRRGGGKEKKIPETSSDALADEVSDGPDSMIPGA